MELPKFVYYIVGLVAFAVVANLALLDYLFIDYQDRLAQLNVKVLSQAAIKPTVPAVTLPATETVKVQSAPVADACPQVCLTAIDTAVKASAAKKTTVVTTPVTTTLPRGEYFIPLGSGSVLISEASSANWKTIAGAEATFDISNYGTIKAAYFEATLRVSSTGEAHARLYDSTTPLVFFSSDIYVSSTTATFVSTPITVSNIGSKTYKVQMYSTLSTGYLDQARIRIVTQ